jgi:hypothetical protein
MEITNPRIIQFFQSHPNLNHEQLLLHFIDFYETNLLSENPEKKIQDHILIDSLQQKLNNILTPFLVTEQNTLSNIYSQLSQLTNVNKTSVLKGKQTEKNYLQFLTNTFSDCEISDCSNIPHSMDILMSQPGQLDIRFDIKDYSTNVPSKEIQKFKNDIVYNMCHGILISDKSGIATKNNYSFDIIDNKYIAFYICNGDSQINNLSHIISFIRNIETIITKNSGVCITPKSIEIIQKELNQYLTYIDSIKSNLQNSIQLCNKLTFSSIKNILEYSSSNNNSISSNFICSNCGESFTTKRKLTFHLKTHSVTDSVSHSESHSITDSNSSTS